MTITRENVASHITELTLWEDQNWKSRELRKWNSSRKCKTHELWWLFGGKHHHHHHHNHRHHHDHGEPPKCETHDCDKEDEENSCSSDNNRQAHLNLNHHQGDDDAADNNCQAHLVKIIIKIMINPYSQPDSKKSAFFYALPKTCFNCFNWWIVEWW